MPCNHDLSKAEPKDAGSIIMRYCEACEGWVSADRGPVQPAPAEPGPGGGE